MDNFLELCAEGALGCAGEGPGGFVELVADELTFEDVLGFELDGGVS